MLAAFTIEGAWLMRQEKDEGTIEVGKRADLVVLERDLSAIPPSEIGEVRVERTIVAGKTVFVAGALAQVGRPPPEARGGALTRRPPSPRPLHGDQPRYASRLNAGHRTWRRSGCPTGSAG